MDNTHDIVKKILDTLKPKYTLTDNQTNQVLKIEQGKESLEVEIPNSSHVIYKTVTTSRRTRNNPDEEPITVLTYCPVPLTFTEYLQISFKKINLKVPIPKVTKISSSISSSLLNKSTKLKTKALLQDIPDNAPEGTEPESKPQEVNTESDLIDFVYTGEKYYYFIYGESKNVTKIQKPIYVYIQPADFTTDVYLQEELGWLDILNHNPEECTTKFNGNEVEVKFKTSTLRFRETSIPWESLQYKEELGKLFKRPASNQVIFHTNKTIQALQRIYYEKYMTMMTFGSDNQILPVFYFNILGELKTYEHIETLSELFKTTFKDIYKNTPYLDLWYKTTNLILKADLIPCTEQDVPKCVASGGTCTRPVTWLRSNLFSSAKVFYIESAPPEEGADNIPGKNIFYEGTIFSGGVVGFLQRSLNTETRELRTYGLGFDSTEILGEQLAGFDKGLEYMLGIAALDPEHKLPDGPWNCSGCGLQGGYHPTGPQKATISQMPSLHYELLQQHHGWFIRMIFLTDPEVLPLWEKLKSTYKDKDDETLFIEYVTPYVEVYTGDIQPPGNEGEEPIELKDWLFPLYED